MILVVAVVVVQALGYLWALQRTSPDHGASIRVFALWNSAACVLAGCAIASAYPADTGSALILGLGGAMGLLALAARYR